MSPASVAKALPLYLPRFWQYRRKLLLNFYWPETHLNGRPMHAILFDPPRLSPPHEEGGNQRSDLLGDQ